MAQGLQIYGPDGALWLSVGTRVFKKLGSFVTVFDLNAAVETIGTTGHKYKYTDSRMIGKNIILMPRSIRYTKTGSSQTYVWPYKIYVNGAEIIWYFESASAAMFGHDPAFFASYSIAEITWDYGWY